MIKHLNSFYLSLMMEKKLEVAIIGHVSIDEIEIKKRKKRQIGGAACYAAFSSKTFARTGIVSRVGRDFPVAFLRRIRNAGIDINGIKITKENSTFFSISYDENGVAKYNAFELNAGRGIKSSDIPESYLNASAFHIAPMNPRKQKQILEFLREKNKDAIISLNTYIGYVKKYKKALLEIIEKTDVFSINDEEAITLTNARGLEHALNILKKKAEKKNNIIIVTIGLISFHGSIVIEKGEINFFPSLYQPVVRDVTGCGDVFAGAFLATYAKTKNAMKAANIANSMASLNATDYSFKAIAPLNFRSFEAFQTFITSRQRKLIKKQKVMEYFLGEQCD